MTQVVFEDAHEFLLTVFGVERRYQIGSLVLNEDVGIGRLMIVFGKGIRDQQCGETCTRQL